MSVQGIFAIQPCQAAQFTKDRGRHRKGIKLFHRRARNKGYGIDSRVQQLFSGRYPRKFSVYYHCFYFKYSVPARDPGFLPSAPLTTGIKASVILFHHYSLWYSNHIPPENTFRNKPPHNLSGGLQSNWK